MEEFLYSEIMKDRNRLGHLVGAQLEPNRYNEWIKDVLTSPVVKEILIIGRDIKFAECSFFPHNKETNFLCRFPLDADVILESNLDSKENVKISLNSANIDIITKEDLEELGFTPYYHSVSTVEVGGVGDFYKIVKLNDLKKELNMYSLLSRDRLENKVKTTIKEYERELKKLKEDEEVLDKEYLYSKLLETFIKDVKERKLNSDLVVEYLKENLK